MTHFSYLSDNVNTALIGAKLFKKKLIAKNVDRWSSA
jgi:hypothetical protein